MALFTLLVPAGLLVLGLGGAAGSYLENCDHEARVCGVHPNNEDGFNSIEDFVLEIIGTNYTLLVNPYAQACATTSTSSNCTDPSLADRPPPTAQKYIYRPQVVLTPRAGGLAIRSFYAGVRVLVRPSTLPVFVFTRAFTLEDMQISGVRQLNTSDPGAAALNAQASVRGSSTPAVQIALAAGVPVPRNQPAATVGNVAVDAAFSLGVLVSSKDRTNPVIDTALMRLDSVSASVISVFQYTGQFRLTGNGSAVVASRPVFSAAGPEGEVVVPAGAGYSVSNTADTLPQAVLRSVECGSTSCSDAAPGFRILIAFAALASLVVVIPLALKCFRGLRRRPKKGAKAQ